MKVKFQDEELTVVMGTYGNGSRAISLTDEDGMPYAKATSVPECGTLPDTNCVWIRDSEENAGMLWALVSGGVVVPTGRTIPTGFIQLHEAKLVNP